MLSQSFHRRLVRHLPGPILDYLASVAYAGRRLPDRAIYLDRVRGGHGLEIGGPSLLFKTVLPLYRVVRTLDGVNFATDTVWEGRIRPGPHYRYFGTARGRQFIAEATDLGGLDAGAYDFLLSSNCLEHIANPLKALAAWWRVLRAGGTLILVLPNKAANFDHRRPYTPFDHLRRDLLQNTTEADLTHLEEILALHDLSRDPPAGDPDAFRTRSLDNFHNRTLHHHVFNLAVIRVMLEYCGFDVVHTTTTPTDLFALATRRCAAP